MKYCKYCGKELNDDETCQCQDNKKLTKDIVKEIGDLGTSLATLSSILIKFLYKKANNVYFEKDKAIIPDCIQPDEDELVVKQYNIASLRSILKCSFAEGKLLVTNKRIIFRSAGMSPLGRIISQQEFAINEIAGIEIKKDYRISFMNIIVCFLLGLFFTMNFSKGFEALSIEHSYLMSIATLLLTVIAFGSCYIFKRKFFINYILICLSMAALSGIEAAYNRMMFLFKFPISILAQLSGIILVLLLLYHVIRISFVPNLIIAIKTKSSSSPIEIRRKELHMLLPIQSQEYTGFSDVMPGPDVEKAANEIGAMINELNTLGDSAIDKWKE